MSVTIDLPTDVERRLRSRAAESGQDLPIYLLNVLKIIAEQPAEGKPSSVPDSDDDDDGESPWRGVFAIDIPYGKYENLGLIDLNAPMPAWAPHIVISSRWIDDADE